MTDDAHLYWEQRRHDAEQQRALERAYKKGEPWAIRMIKENSDG